MKYKDLQIDQRIKDAILEIGFDEPTDIQARAIPELQAGFDVIGQAQTGTGKTAAFGLPMVEMCSQSNKGIESLVLAPTRELAVQIVDALRSFTKYKKLKIATVIGGMSYNRQMEQINKNPNIVVATPGRLVDYLERKKINLSKINFFCIDEADEMLKIGFKKEIDTIISFLPKKKQSALFSATLDDNVRRIASKIMNNHKEILVSSGLQTINTIDQYAILVNEKDKLRVFTDIMDVKAGSKSLVFGRTKKRVDELVTALNTIGYKARALHGDLDQRQRLQVVDEFKKGGFECLVATDVAARGIDISDIKFVYNFDLPQEIEYYVHRIGRTGRARSKGVSFSFVRESEMEHLKKIEEQTSSKIKFVMPPTKEEMHIASQSVAVDKIVEGTDLGKKLKRHMGMAKKLMEEYGAEVALAAAIEVLVDRKPKDLPTLSKEPAVSGHQKKPRRRSHRNRRPRRKK